MERHRCKLCYKKFANGRALGGHMRSHMINHLPIPSYETESWPHELSSPSRSSSSSLSSSDEDEKGLGDYKLRENPNKSIKFLSDVEFSSFGSSSVSVPEREIETETERNLTPDRETSETESSKINHHNNPTRKRSKRHFGIIFNDKNKNKNNQPTSIDIETTSSMSPTSSVSEVTSEKDVALCLMMLSRDNWPAGGGKGKFTCLTCNKVFRSYQALGGHRASHKKLRSPPAAKPGPGSDPSKQQQSKTHECPVCFRVFASAQALGGHKRTHSGAGGGASRSNAVEECPRKAARRENNGGFIDLNLPAPVDDHDHDDDDISRISLSAVSDPYF